MNNRILTMFILLLLVLVAWGQARASDPWDALQGRFKESPTPPVSHDQGPQNDPWARLRAIYLPFTEEEESAALTSLEAAQRVSGYLHKALLPYEPVIEEASVKFNIPREIIGAVIMVESGGDCMARAKTSSASGLMQTIKSTFKEARQDLISRGIQIKDDPFDPASSIMAGSWYLDRMFEKASDDNKDGVRERHDIGSWRSPVEYYYAGPGNGVKDDDIVIIYSGGRKVFIDKAAYSNKVMRWAKIMERK